MKEGGGWGDILTLISLYLAFCIPGSLSLSLSLTPSRFLSFLCSLPSVPASLLLGISCILCAVSALVCVGWYSVYPNVFGSVFCLLEQVSSSDAKRQDVMFKLSTLFDCKSFSYLSISSHSLYENDSVSFDLCVAYRYKVFFFSFSFSDLEARL